VVIRQGFDHLTAAFHLQIARPVGERSAKEGVALGFGRGEGGGGGPNAVDQGRRGQDHEGKNRNQSLNVH
jgi:hypothetical protein